MTVIRLNNICPPMLDASLPPVEALCISDKASAIGLLYDGGARSEVDEVFQYGKSLAQEKCGSSSIETWDAEEVPKRFSELQRINFPEPWASAHCCVASDGQCFGVGFASNKKSRIRVANVALALHSALIRKQEQRWSISTGSNEVLRALYALAGDRLKAPKVIARWKEVHTPASSTTASQCAESASSGQQRESCAQRVSCAQREPSAQRERASPCDDSRPLRAMRSAHHGWLLMGDPLEF
ncbi:unnamed protein product [Effrenium voratum]|nr:unnamed protein product [Effrenium voratum]CAJ1436222.1 unnamed protein product [Effrenium voratum]